MNKKEKGQGMVEFALVLPLILLLVIGIAALFVTFAVLVTVHNAASEGGREAQVWRPDGTSTCASAVMEGVVRITPFFDPDRDILVVSENCSNDPWARIPSGNKVFVGIVINWELPFFSTLFKDEWDPPILVPLPGAVNVRHE